MPIMGIDYDKCINCGICITACAHPGSYFKKDEEGDRVIFEDPDNICIECGQCIAQCPTDAIIYSDMGESLIFENVGSPEKIISFDPFFKFLSAQRSVRQYKKEKVSKEILDKVLMAMSQAPTAANIRSERFTVVSDPQKIKQLSDAIQKEFKKDPNMRVRSSKHIEEYSKRFESPLFYDAPHVIFISSPSSVAMEGFNIGIIVTYGRLAAQALGLGTCWIGHANTALQLNPKIGKIVKLRGRIFGVFTIGYPAVKFYRTAPRSSLKVKFM